MREDGTNQHPAFYKTEKVRYSFALADLGIAAPEQMSGQNTSTPATSTRSAFSSTVSKPMVSGFSRAWA